MKKWAYLALLAVALLTLAAGGWIAQGIASVRRPAGRVAPRAV